MLEWGLIHYGYLIVFVGTILEGDATLLAASFLAHHGYLRLPLIILVSSVATTAANQFFYILARRHGHAYLERRSASDRRFAKVTRWVQRRGVLLLLFSRFLWGLRVAIPAACGATGMRPAIFFIVNLAGAFLWSVPFTLLGYLGADAVSRFYGNLRKYEWHIAAVLMLGTLLLVLWRTHGEEFKEAWIAMRQPDEIGVVSVEVISHPHPARHLLHPPSGDEGDERPPEP